MLPRDLDVLNDLAMVRRINGVPRVPDVRDDGAATQEKRPADAAIALLLAHVACSKAEEMIVRWEGLCSI